MRASWRQRKSHLSTSLIGEDDDADIEAAAMHEHLGVTAHQLTEKSYADDSRYSESRSRPSRRPMQASSLGLGIQEAPMGDFPPASGEGPIGDPHSVHTAEGSAQAALEDRGVRGAFLSYSSDGTTQQIELPLAFAQIECKGAAVTVTVHKDVHPDCELGGKPISLRSAHV